MIFWCSIIKMLNVIKTNSHKVVKNMSKLYGYCRVSTKGQLEGNGIEVQQQEILVKYNNAELHMEQYSGKTTDRPVFNDLINKLQSGDTLVVTKLDRLARNTVEGIAIVEKLFEKGVSVHVLNVGLLENTSMGKFFLTTLLAVAEMERNTIIERTQAGKEIAKTKEGFKEGRPKSYTDTQINYALDLIQQGNSYTSVVKMTQISKATLTRAMKKRKTDT
jgi:DNA invertase Pin-like site-specific DNA recombinase